MSTITQSPPPSTSHPVEASPVATVVEIDQDTPGKSCRSNKKLICIVEKLNMVFLVVFVCYLAWSIPANYGLFRGNAGTNSASKNHSYTEDEGADIQDTKFNSSWNIFNGDRKSDLNFWLHAWNTKRTNAKNEDKKLFPDFSVKNEDLFNIDFTEPNNRKNKKNRDEFKSSKNKKGRRKNRKKFIKNKGLSRSTIREIIERVAQDTMANGGVWNSNNNGNGEPIVSISVGENPMEKDVDGGDNENGSTKIPFEKGKDSLSKRPWGEWAACSVTCGVGQRERKRKCGHMCTEVESMVCHRPACEGTADKDETFYILENDKFLPQRPKEYIDPEVDTCGQWMDCNRGSIEVYLNKSHLPSCPCKQPIHLDYLDNAGKQGAERHFTWYRADDNDEDVYVYKPQANACLRSKLVRGTTTLASQMCCYDSTQKLITRGRNAGTPNLISPEISPQLHYKVDITPWIICKGDWTRFYEIIPPDNGYGCPTNPNEEDFLFEVQMAKNY